MGGRRRCTHCGREEPSYIYDPHCAAATDRSPWVYCEFTNERRGAASVEDARNALLLAAAMFARGLKDGEVVRHEHCEPLYRAAFELVAAHLETTNFVGRVQAAAWVRSLSVAKEAR